MPRDGGFLILSKAERSELLAADPTSERWIRPYTGAEDFLNGGERYCLWLGGASPAELRSHPLILTRLDQVRRYRLASKAESTRRAASSPGTFVQLAQPSTNYLLIPRVSSVRRAYIPIGFMSKSVIANDQVLTVAGATLYHFGVLTSAMHMTWMRYTCGRLKSDYRYSKDVVYNNFCWPDSTDAQKDVVSAAAQRILDARSHFSDSTLAELYDPLLMPPALLGAHRELDALVDAAYGRRDFKSEPERIAFLFDRYQSVAAPTDVSRPTDRKTGGGRKRSG